MKKFLWIISVIFMVCLFFYVHNTPVYAQNNALYFRAYGDSISAGYGLEDYNNYAQKNNKTSDICLDSYSQVFSSLYTQNLGGTALGFGVTGNKTKDLCDILQPYINKTAGDYSSFYNTDVFTLCIGANNILHTATQNFENYLTGKITQNQYQTLLQVGLNDFKNDYLNTILPCFINNTKQESKIFVMTVYNPYKYTSLNDITVNTGDSLQDSTTKAAISFLDISFQSMLSTTIDYLQQINDIIRQNTSNKVICVDIYNLFDSFTEQQYSLYINSNASKIIVTKPDISSLNFSNFVTHCDPHPTKQGHYQIAMQHAKQFPVINLKTQTNLNDITTNNVVFEIQKIGGINYTYKLYKNIQNNVLLIDEFTQNTISVLSEKLIGQGIVYVEVYNDNQKVLTTNSLNFKYTKVPQLPQTNNQNNNNQAPNVGDDIVKKNKNLNAITTILLILTLFISFGIVVFIFIKNIKHN